MDNTFYVDDITYGDLELDEIYNNINYTKSTAGADALMKRLRNPYICECDEFKCFRRLIDDLSHLDEASSDKNGFKSVLLQRLKRIGLLRNYSYFDSLDKICAENIDSNTKHYLYITFVIISFILIFISPGWGIVLFFVSIAFSVTNYFKCKNILADKLVVFSYIIRMLKGMSGIDALYNGSDNSGTGEKDGISGGVLAKKLSDLSDIQNIFKPFMSFSFLIQPGVSTSGNVVSIALDYVRIIFHADIIKYNSMLGFLKEHRDDAGRLYEIVGDLDAALSINEYKNRCGHGDGNSNAGGNPDAKLCKPVFHDNSDSSNASAQFIFKDGYHPLIDSPVVNSIETSKNILLTGSNASGKSTYLKTVAINAIFAQSFYFCFASEYKAGFMRVYTSMALRDSIKNNESYFMAEIKSLKRIFDAGKSGVKVLCIIDEVLRGTNTVERISASVEVLKALCSDKFLCFAATHDIELTELLKGVFTNYCFKEDYTDGDIKFDYLLHEGSADTKNAIKLLKILGFDETIVNAAENRVSNYLTTGSFL